MLHRIIRVFISICERLLTRVILLSTRPAITKNENGDIRIVLEVQDGLLIKLFYYNGGGELGSCYKMN